MAYDKDARTAFASKALELSELFRIKFARTRFSGEPPRVVRVQEPQGSSTGGGRQAREPIVLVPEGGDGQGGLVCGWMNVAENRAEMRPYEMLAELHRRRFQAPLDLPEAEYDAFLAEARRFFSEEGIPMGLAQELPEIEPRAAERPPAPSSSEGGMSAPLVAGLALGAVLLGLLLGYALFAPG